MPERDASTAALVALCATSLVVATIVATTGVAPGATSATDTEETNATDDDWEQYRGGPGHAGATNDAGPSGPYAEARWVRMGGEPNTPPVVADGTVYVGATTDREYTNLSGVVKAVNQTTGEIRWKRNVGAIRRPIAVAEGLVFVVTANTVVTDRGYPTEYRTLALDAETGETVWRRNGSLGLVVDNGTLYGGERAYDASTGDLLWEDPNVSVRAVADGTFYGTYSPNESIYNHSLGIVAWDAEDRSVEWRWFPGGSGVEDFAVANSSVYATIGPDETAAVDAGDGSLRWQRTVESPTENGTVDWIGEPTIADGRVYVAANDESERVGALYAFDAADGRTEWQFRDGTEFGGAPAAAANSVYVGAQRGDEFVGYGLNASTGAERWNRTLWFNDALFYANTVVDDGVVVFNYDNQARPGGDDNLDWVVAMESSGMPSDDTPVADIVLGNVGDPDVTITTDPPNAGERDLDAGSNVTLTADASDPDGNVTTIEWDVDADDEFEREGASVTVQLTFCGSMTVTVHVTDDEGETTFESVTLSTV